MPQSLRRQWEKHARGETEKRMGWKIGQKQHNVWVCGALCAFGWEGHEMCLKEQRFHSSVTLSLCTCSLRRWEGENEKEKKWQGEEVWGKRELNFIERARLSTSWSLVYTVLLLFFLKSAQRHALKYHDTGLLLKNTYIPTPPQKYIINTERLGTKGITIASTLLNIVENLPKSTWRDFPTFSHQRVEPWSLALSPKSSSKHWQRSKCSTFFWYFASFLLSHCVVYKKQL